MPTSNLYRKNSRPLKQQDTPGYNAVYMQSRSFNLDLFFPETNATFACMQDSLLRQTQDLDNMVTLQLKICLWLCTSINSILIEDIRLCLNSKVTQNALKLPSKHSNSV